MLSRRHAVGLLAGTLLSACVGDDSRQKGKLFVGDQRGGSRVVLQGAKRLDDVPYEIVWSQFPNAAPLLEALNAGAIDSGIGGDSAFIFAAGTDAKIKAIGAQATRGMGPVVLVRRDSPIRSLADLAGHKVATPRGSISHNHVLAVLEAYDQPYEAVSFAFLSPSDGRAALQSGAVDAWAIWDPYYSAAQQQGNVRVLADGSQLNLTGSFYLATRSFAERNGAFVQQVLDTFSQADALTLSQREQSIELLAAAMGLPKPVLASYLDHRPPTRITPVSAQTAAAQQHTADLFYASHLVPVKLTIADRIWHPSAPLQ